MKKIVSIALVALFLALSAHISLAQDRDAGKKLGDYMAGIEKHSAKTMELYREGRIQDAKAEWESAYFENFEYLEGPIRRNISAKRNSELEYKFAQIRKMIKRQDPLTSIEVSIKDLLVELKKTLHELDDHIGTMTKTEKSVKGVDLDQKSVNVKDASWVEVAEEIKTKIGAAIKTYGQASAKESANAIQDIYFDVFEESGMEARIGALNPEFKAKLEGDFNKIIARMKTEETKEEIEKSFLVMQQDLDRAVKDLDRKSGKPATLFFYSFFIILREGFEAILIICAIIAYLIKTGHKDKVRIIYNGCIIAIVLSVVTAILVKWVFRVSAANQEILEGITMLIAVVVLFFVSFWLISKVEAHKWMSYIKGKVDRSLTTGSMYALWFAAFLAVYREGAETVLFYQALVPAASGPAGTGSILGGFIIGCIALTVVFIGVRFGSMRLPLKPFFIATSALLYYMAFVFAGKGVMELIEGRLIGPSLITNGPSAPFLGIYPYWQTIIPQGLLIIAALIGLRITFAKR